MDHRNVIILITEGVDKFYTKMTNISYVHMADKRLKLS
jgi:hypothetical protein